MKSFLSTLALIAIGSAASADCPSQPPQGLSVNLQTGDQQVNAAWLQDNLAGRRLVFADGTENYDSDGSYSYTIGGQTYRADSYRFYDNGYRCIDYSNARFDYYVVNNGQLVLVNSDGERFTGRLTN